MVVMVAIQMIFLFVFTKLGPTVLSISILHHKLNDLPNNRNFQVKTWHQCLYNEWAAGSVSTTPLWVLCQHDNNVTTAAAASLVDPLNP